MAERMGHSGIGVTMNVYRHLFDGKQRELTSDIDDLLDRSRSKVGWSPTRRCQRGRSCSNPTPRATCSS